MNFIADTFHLNQFKSAAELDLTEEQRNALIATLNLLETRTIIHLPDDAETEDADDQTPRTAFFNMSLWGGLEDYPIVFEGRCGSVACIGGTAEIIAGKRIFEEAREQEVGVPIRDLFFGYVDDAVTTEQAARVLRHYLTTGVVDWSSVQADIEGWDEIEENDEE